MVAPFDPFADATPKPFTDRDPFKDLFWKTLAHLRPEHPSVLAFHGVGGIGKSALLDELRRLATAPSGSSESRAKTDGNAATSWAGLDFSAPEHRSPDTALRYLAQHLHDTYSWAFPSFSLAYAEFWSRKNPDVPLQQRTLPFVEAGDLLLDVLGGFDELSEKVDLPGLGLITKLPKLLHRLDEKRREAFTKRLTPELRQLGSLEKADDVLDRLSFFFAKDVRAALELDGRKLVFALDGYDDLIGGRWDAFGSKEQDRWVRNWIRQMPGTLWLVAVRDPLPWVGYRDEGWTAEDLCQHSVDVLEPHDADTFLQEAGIEEADIRAHLVKALHGHPLHLSVSVDTYREIAARGETPSADRFATAPDEVVSCFLKNLSGPEKDALFVLSAARWWDEDVFDRLMRHFNVGYPAESMRRDLVRFSFVEPLPGDPKRWKIHVTVRTALAERSQSVKDAYRVLFELYADEVENLDTQSVTPRQRSAFSEAAYHARQALIPHNACQWFFSKSLDLDRKAEWGLLEIEAAQWVEWCRKTLGGDHAHTLTSMHQLALFYKSQAKYYQAESTLIILLERRYEILGADNRDTIVTMNILGLVYLSQGKLMEAREMLDRSLVHSRRVMGDSHLDTIQMFANLGAMYSGIENASKDEYAKGEELLRIAIQLYEAGLGAEAEQLISPLGNLAMIYYKTKRYEESLQVLYRTLRMREERFGVNHPGVYLEMNRIGLVCHALKRYEEAEEYYIKSLESKKRLLGEDHESTLKSVHSLACLYMDTGRHDEAKLLFECALEGFAKSLDYNPALARIVQRDLELLKRRMRGEE